jgi:hypothetical protein
MNFFVNLCGLVSLWQKETWLNIYQKLFIFNTKVKENSRRTEINPIEDHPRKGIK